MQSDEKDKRERTKEPTAEQVGKPVRLISLDAFRGLTIGLMLLVNNTALDTATPRQLTHAPWNQGITAADLVFPWFLLCVGLAIPYASASFKKQGLPMWRYDLKAAGRALSLVILGCLIDSSLAKRPIFDLGVLQLIGLAYFIGAIFYDLPIHRRVIVAGAFLVGYWAMIKFMPLPGDRVAVFDETKNVILHINRTFLARYNLSGLLSIVPTGAMVLIGTVLGDGLRRPNSSHLWKMAFLAISGLVLAALGLVWNLSLPYNKTVWTPSYIVFTAGLGSLIMALFYVVIDFKGWKWWAYPLVVFGSNAIIAYVAPILVKIYILQEWTVYMGHGQFRSLQNGYLQELIAGTGRIAGGWLYTASYIFVWWLILFYLYRKKIFLRV